MFHSGEPLDVRLWLRAPVAIDDFVVGVGIFNAEGVCCYGTNTDIEELKAERIFGDAEAVFSIESLDLVEGHVQARRRHPQESTATRTTTIGCCTRSG